MCILLLLTKSYLYLHILSFYTSKWNSYLKLSTYLEFPFRASYHFSAYHELWAFDLARGLALRQKHLGKMPEVFFSTVRSVARLWHSYSLTIHAHTHSNTCVSKTIRTGLLLREFLGLVFALPERTRIFPSGIDMARELEDFVQTIGTSVYLSTIYTPTHTRAYIC